MSMPVSGPGALSQRTDTQAITTPTGMPYGEAGALQQVLHVVGCPGQEVVEAQHLDVTVEQGLAQVGPEEACPAGHDGTCHGSVLSAWSVTECVREP